MTLCRLEIVSQGLLQYCTMGMTDDSNTAEDVFSGYILQYKTNLMLRWYCTAARKIKRLIRLGRTGFCFLCVHQSYYQQPHLSLAQILIFVWTSLLQAAPLYSCKSLQHNAYCNNQGESYKRHPVICRALSAVDVQLVSLRGDRLVRATVHWKVQGLDSLEVETRCLVGLWN